MKTLRDLMTPPAHLQGRVEALIVRGQPRERARRIDETVALAGIGLADDRLGQRGEAELSTRQVTLIQHEHLPLIAAFARSGPLDPVDLRRNLVISGINLLSLKKVRLRVGEAVIDLLARHSVGVRSEVLVVEVEGAEKGDAIAVYIESMVPRGANPRGTCCLIPNFGALTGTDYRWTAAFVTASLPAHLFDLARRARGGSRSAAAPGR